MARLGVAMSAERQDLHPFAGPGHIPPERTSFERRHRLARPDLLRDALEQLLAGLPPWEIRHDEVRALAATYGVEPDAAHDVGLRLWLAALDVFAANADRWPVKNAYLRALQEMLDLQDEDVEPARVKAVAPYFRKALRDVVADHVIGGDERARLTRLAVDLDIPAGTAHKAIERTARTLLDNLWNVATGSGRLTPEGVALMRTASGALGVAPTPGQEHVLRQVEAAMAAAKERAELERVHREREEEERRRRAQADRERLAAWLARPSAAPPPSEPTPIDLDPGETELWTEVVEWHELLVDQTDPFAGPRLTLQDQGALHITDQRLVFVGRRMLRTIALSDVTSGVRYPDALRIRRRVDRDIFFLPSHSERVELLASVLARVTGWSEPTVESHPALMLATGRPSPQR